MKGGWEYDEGEVIWTGDLPDTQVLMGSGEATDPLFAGALRRAVIQRKAGVDTVHTTRTIMAGLMMTLEGTVSAVTCRNAIINEFGSDPNKAMCFVDDALATMGSMVTTMACTLHTAVTGELCDPEVHDHRDMALHLGQHMSALIESGLRQIEAVEVPDVLLDLEYDRLEAGECDCPECVACDEEDHDD